MPITIITADDERHLATYQNLRNEVRAKMGYGVYPNCIVATEAYDVLETALEEGGPLEQFAEYHATLMAPLAPYITTLRQAMNTITSIMEAVEAIQPGTFGIPLPLPPEGTI